MVDRIEEVEQPERPVLIAQRGELAAALQRVMAKLREESDIPDDPMAPFRFDADWEAAAIQADSALARVA